MHQALLVCDILLETFKHVNEINWEDPSVMPSVPTRAKLSVRRSLAALAATCKTFYEPAMNELWADVDGLNPLLGCVTRLRPMIYCPPMRAWRDPLDFGDIEPLSANEVHQFLRHAARVRFMRFESATTRDFRFLSVLPQNESMFPSLQSFTASLPCPTRYLHLFLSPALRRCGLEATDLDLKLIATRCVALEHLSMVLAKYSTIADRVSALSDGIRLCKRLVTLYCRCLPLDWAAWEHLSNLSGLLTLTTHMDNVVPSPSDFNNITLGPFLNLTTLSFQAHTAVYFTTLMQYSEFPSLKKIGLNFNLLPLADAERLFHVLSQCKACQTLEHVNIQGFGPGDLNSDSSWTEITQFRCPQLRTLMLRFPGCSIHLDNGHLLKAMSCWPQIRFLALEDMRYREATITFHGLLTALRQCPLLKDLSLLINMVNLDVDPTAESLRNTSLQTWDVRSAVVVDAEAVARVIFSLLPRFASSYINSPPSRFRYASVWDNVWNHLRRFKSSPVLDFQDEDEDAEIWTRLQDTLC